jgi:hypothetical protein
MTNFEKKKKECEINMCKSQITEDQEESLINCEKCKIKGGNNVK